MSLFVTNLSKLGRVVQFALGGTGMSSAPDNSESISPSKIALGELLKRAQDDSSLPADIKAAVLADLDSQAPAALEQLRAVLGKNGTEDAA